MATYEHPRAGEMRATVMQMETRNGKRARFGARLERLLAIYAVHGAFTKQNLDADLWTWLGHTYLAHRRNDVGKQTRQLLDLLDLDGLFPSYRPRAHTTKAEQADLMKKDTVEPTVVAPVFAHDPHLRNELLALAPDDLLPVTGEDRAETVWWYWIRLWQEQVTGEGGIPDAQLMRFIGVTRDMRERELLSPDQLDMVSLLERPQSVGTRSRTKPYRKLRLVGGRA